jgi:hypothetical protein
MDKKKLSKCIITGGKELLKELGIDFQDMTVEREERTSETLKIEKEKEGEKENGINPKL